jgi:hypothetical protein
LLGIEVIPLLYLKSQSGFDRLFNLNNAVGSLFFTKDNLHIFIFGDVLDFEALFPTTVSNVAPNLAQHGYASIIVLYHL